MALEIGLKLSVGAQMFADNTPVPAPTEPARYVDPSVVSPGLVGFFLFFGLGLATLLLWLSMNRQLKRIKFDDGSGSDTPDFRPPTLPVSGQTGRKESGPER